MLRDLANRRTDFPAHNVFEHVNAYDMQSVRLTILEDPAIDRRSSHMEAAGAATGPARHRPYPLLCFHVIGVLSL